jgi:hypothetical protein
MGMVSIAAVQLRPPWPQCAGGNWASGNWASGQLGQAGSAGGEGCEGRVQRELAGAEHTEQDSERQLPPREPGGRGQQERCRHGKCHGVRKLPATQHVAGDGQRNCQ